jgi:hypothetical protein
MSRYQLPAWADFEFGTSPVLWEPKQPKAGETMTVWYNPELTGLQNGDYVAFNGAPPPLIFPCAPTSGCWRLGHHQLGVRHVPHVSRGCC